MAGLSEQTQQKLKKASCIDAYQSANTNKKPVADRPFNLRLFKDEEMH